MHGTSFDWLTWCGGGLSNLGLATRYNIIKDNIHIIRKYAIGYLEAEHCVCRPKENYIAVMFLKDEEYFWTHLRKEEFDLICEEENRLDF